MQVADGDGALGGRRAVRGVCVAENTSCGKGAGEAIKEGADDQPVVVHDVGVFCGEDGDDFADDGTEGADDD